MEDSKSETIEKNQEVRSRKGFKYIWVAVGTLLLVFGFFLIQNNKENILKKEEIHFHAGFQVYVDEKLVEFSDDKYMTIGACGERDEDEQNEKAHLHDNIGDIVHVHRSGALWGDLFKNIKYNFDLSKPIKAFVNGSIVNDIFERSISPYDSLILVSGEIGNDNYILQNAVTKERILEIESKSESCSS